MASVQSISPAVATLPEALARLITDETVYVFPVYRPNK